MKLNNESADTLAERERCAKLAIKVGHECSESTGRAIEFAILHPENDEVEEINRV